MHLCEPGCAVVFAGGAAIPLLHTRRNTACQRDGGDSLLTELNGHQKAQNSVKTRLSVPALVPQTPAIVPPHPHVTGSTA